MIKKTRIYKEGDAEAKLVYVPHGRRTYGYGHVGYEFGYVLYVYKGDTSKGYQFAMSLHPQVSIAYIKAVVKAVAETPMPDHRVSNVYWWLKGKTRKGGS